MNANRAVATVVCCIAILVGLSFLYEPPAPAIPPNILATSDSLVATAPAHDSALQASRLLGDTLHRRQRAAAARERARRDSADRARHRADSIAAAADDARAWYQAYIERTQEAMQLRHELLEKDTRIAALEADTLRLHQDKIDLIARNLVYAKNSQDLRIAAETAVKAGQCRVAWRVRCPSRMETAVATTVLLVVVDAFTPRAR
jgi:hypothetical protein